MDEDVVRAGWGRLLQGKGRQEEVAVGGGNCRREKGSATGRRQLQEGEKVVQGKKRPGRGEGVVWWEVAAAGRREGDICEEAVAVGGKGVAREKGVAGWVEAAGGDGRVLQSGGG